MSGNVCFRPIADATVTADNQAMAYDRDVLNADASSALAVYRAACRDGRCRAIEWKAVEAVAARPVTFRPRACHGMGAHFQLTAFLPSEAAMLAEDARRTAACEHRQPLQCLIGRPCRAPTVPAANDILGQRASSAYASEQVSGRPARRCRSASFRSAGASSSRRSRGLVASRAAFLSL